MKIARIYQKSKLGYVLIALGVLLAFWVDVAQPFDYQHQPFWKVGFGLISVAGLVLLYSKVEVLIKGKKLLYLLYDVNYILLIIFFAEIIMHKVRSRILAVLIIAVAVGIFIIGQNELLNKFFKKKGELPDDERKV